MTQVTVVGNLTSDVEIKFTPKGDAVASFTVAESKRVFDKTANEWKDAEPTYWRCSLWRQYAEHLADSCGKGTRVIVTGEVKQRTYETKQGEKRTVLEVEVSDVGPALRYATATVKRVERVQVARTQSESNADDPWQTPAPF